MSGFGHVVRVVSAKDDCLGLGRFDDVLYGWRRYIQGSSRGLIWHGVTCLRSSESLADDLVRLAKEEY